MAEITKTSMKRVFKANGAPRVSKGAAIEMARVVDEYANTLAKEVINVMKYTNRKTIVEEDIFFVMRDKKDL